MNGCFGSKVDLLSIGAQARSLSRLGKSKGAANSTPTSVRR